MDTKMMKLLEDRGGNYLFPFFWLHGEEEDVLRDYMRAIDENHVKAVCVESRPHPDYCGPLWWRDMDIILDEARKRNMKIWILDDSHFPTGYANGAMKNQKNELCRQSICCRIKEASGGESFFMSQEEVLHPDPPVPTFIEEKIGDKNPRVFDDDQLIGIFARDEEGNCLDLSSLLGNDSEAISVGQEGLKWIVPDGKWKVYTMHLSRNMGYHRNYINMMKEDSCRVLLDAVYEPHYTRYKDDFGTTIAGFFSDEPELGNGHLYEQDIQLGTMMDYPWSDELGKILQERFGDTYLEALIYLWENDGEANEKARVRYAFMDGVTRLVEKNFSLQIGDWCRAHGVEYIGHLIEDNNMHARTGSSLGHFFRGLAGQDMSGIDNIGGQVLPQQEDVSYDHGVFARRDGEFYHFMLGKLASSAAAIEPLKKGNSMCEIFGAYGWSEGLRLEKYLLDHFMVRGINHFVPHAYSAKAFPDPDCPPHFYANGNHPQHRHFGELMAYTNRVCELIQGGRHIAPVAVLYHGDGEWAGDTMFSHRIGRILAEYPIDYDYVPMDIFAEREKYQTRVEQKKLLVNTQEYSLLIVPKMQYVTEAFANGVIEMSKAGVMLCFIEDYPEGLSDVSGAARVEKVQSELLEMKKYPCFELNELKNYLEKLGVAELVMEPSCKDLRYYHYEHHEGLGVYLFVNEGTSCYEGKLGIQEARKCLIYNAWENRLEELPKNNSGEVFLRIEPLKSLILLADDKFTMLDDSMELCKPLSLDVIREMTEVEINPLWKRSTCRSIDYPKFDEEKEIFLPDRLADEAPEFSGFVRYENSLFIDYADNEKLPNKAILEIGDAYEGVEVFVNETSLGIQIIPPFLYDVEKALKPGVNTIVIEVATSLEREMAKMPDMFGRVTEATTQSGITGMVRLWVE